MTLSLLSTVLPFHAWLGNNSLLRAASRGNAFFPNSFFRALAVIVIPTQRNEGTTMKTIDAGQKTVQSTSSDSTRPSPSGNDDAQRPTRAKLQLWRSKEKRAKSKKRTNRSRSRRDATASGIPGAEPNLCLGRLRFASHLIRNGIESCRTHGVWVVCSIGSDNCKVTTKRLLPIYNLKTTTICFQMVFYI